MDGKGCWRDNVFIERVWHSIKYEEVYLHAYETVSAAEEGIGRYISFLQLRFILPHEAMCLINRDWLVRHSVTPPPPCAPRPEIQALPRLTSPALRD